jgi:hypothetical protein
MPDGSIQMVTRKSFIRRSARKDAWRYHLREMAIAEEPLRYIRRYLNVEEDLVEESAGGAGVPAAPRKAGALRSSQSKAQPKSPRPLPAGPPAFLRRPYP